jgi:tRNA threonylcarbamoyladenosine biosynthesis protein TsaB
MSDDPPASARPLLAFDCAGAALSAAVGRGERLLAARCEALARGHGERLFGLLETVLADAGCGYADLGGLVVTRGPGGFTGVRIGLAAARGLALATGLPLAGVTGFRLAGAGLAASEADLAGRTCVAVLESKRAEAFVQVLPADGGEAPAAAALAARPADLDGLLPPGPLALCGDAAAAAAAALVAAGRDVLAPESAQRLDARHLPGLFDAPSLPADPAPEPLYLRPPDVTLPAAGQA